ncbi:hypothetical protein EJB05_25696, partial [Eragrostis curvula]
MFYGHYFIPSNFLSYLSPDRCTSTSLSCKANVSGSAAATGSAITNKSAHGIDLLLGKPLD